MAPCWRLLFLLAVAFCIATLIINPKLAEKAISRLERDKQKQEIEGTTLPDEHLQERSTQQPATDNNDNRNNCTDQFARFQDDRFWSDFYDFLTRDELMFDTTYGLYTHRGLPVIWTFWDYQPMPSYIKIAVETMKCQNEGEAFVALINESGARRLLGDFHPAFQYLFPAHKADYIRCRLLLKYGGLWTDPDTVGWKSLQPYFDMLRDKQLDMWGWDWFPEESPISIGVMGPVRANSIPFHVWKAKVDEILERNFQTFATQNVAKDLYPLAWNGLLGAIMIPLMKALLQKKSIRYESADGVSTIGQLIVYMPGDMHESALREPQQIRQYIGGLKDTPLLMFHNSGQALRTKVMSIKKFAKKTTLLAQLVKTSLEQCATRERRCISSQLHKLFQVAGAKSRKRNSASADEDAERTGVQNRVYLKISSVLTQKDGFKFKIQQDERL